MTLPSYQNLVDLAEDHKDQCCELWLRNRLKAVIQLRDQNATLTLYHRATGDELGSMILGSNPQAGHHPNHADEVIEGYTEEILERVSQKLTVRELRDFLKAHGEPLRGFVGASFQSESLRYTFTDLDPSDRGSYPYDAATLSMSMDGQDIELCLFVAARRSQSNPALQISRGVRIRQHGELNSYLPEIRARMKEMMSNAPTS